MNILGVTENLRWSRGLVDQKTIFSAFDFSEMGFRGF